MSDIFAPCVILLGALGGILYGSFAFMATTLGL